MAESRAEPSLGDLIATRRAELRLSYQRLAELVGCARSYLWKIEREGSAAAPSEDLLRKLEEALHLPAGRLVSAARWQATPREVRAQVATMAGSHQAAQRLAEILTESKLGAGERTGKLGDALDRAYRSGELKRLIDRIAPDPADAGVGRAGVLPVRATLPLEVPLINKVAAGYPREFTDLAYPARVADEYVRCPDLSDPDAFACRVVGDSMLPEYREGDIVVFSPARAVKSGMDCFARIEPDHESTFKRVYFDDESGERIRLQPLNPAYAPRVLAREEIAGLYAAVSVTRSL